MAGVPLWNRQRAKPIRGMSRDNFFELIGASGGAVLMNSDAIPKAGPLTGAIRPSRAALARVSWPRRLQASTQAVACPIASVLGRQVMVRFPPDRDVLKLTALVPLECASAGRVEAHPVSAESRTRMPMIRYTLRIPQQRRVDQRNGHTIGTTIMVAMRIRKVSGPPTLTKSLNL